VQTAPQNPQFIASFCTSTQPAEQHVRASAHGPEAESVVQSHTPSTVQMSARSR
jgi:hypothetical protein